MIRPAELSDARQLQAVNAAIVRADRGVVMEVSEIRPTDHWRAHIARFLHPGDLLLVAEVDGVVVGSLDIERIPVDSLYHNAELSMGVTPTHQGLGLGRALVDAGLEWSIDHEIGRLELYCLADNHRALALYESVGFVRAYLRKAFVRRRDGRVVDDWYMEWTHG